MLLCAEENIALQGEHFSPYSLPPPLLAPNFMKCGLTREEADICFLYSERTHSCSKATVFSDELSSSCNESSHPGVIRAQEHIALREPLSS